jgi:hypothetical protein
VNYYYIFQADDYKDPIKQSKQARDAALVKGRKGQMKTNNSDITEDKSKCLEYSEMVRIFKPLIVQNLLVHDILPSLPFLGLY